MSINISSWACGICEHDFIYEKDLRFSICFLVGLVLCIRIILLIAFGFVKRKEVKIQMQFQNISTILAVVDTIVACAPIAIGFAGVAPPYVHFFDVGVCSFLLLPINAIVRHGIAGKKLLFVIASLFCLQLLTFCLIAYAVLDHYRISTNILNYKSLLLISLCIRIPLLLVVSVHVCLSIYKSNRSYAAIPPTTEFPSLQAPLLDYSEDKEQFMDITKAHSYWSAIFFSWLNPLLDIAQYRTLELEDLPALPTELSSEVNTELLREKWTGSSRLLIALADVYLWRYLVLGSLLATSTLMGLAGPLALQALVRAAEVSASAEEVALIIFLLFLCKFTAAMCSTHYNSQTTNLSISISAALRGSLYRKIFRLSVSSRQGNSVGGLTNIFVTDVQRVADACVVLHYFWVLPLQITLAMILLYRSVSWAMFSGLGIIVLILTINNFVSKKIKVANDK